MLNALKRVSRLEVHFSTLSDHTLLDHLVVLQDDWLEFGLYMRSLVFIFVQPHQLPHIWRPVSSVFLLSLVVLVVVCGRLLLMIGVLQELEVEQNHSFDCTLQGVFLIFVHELGVYSSHLRMNHLIDKGKHISEQVNLAHIGLQLVRVGCALTWIRVTFLISTRGRCLVDLLEALVLSL